MHTDVLRGLFLFDGVSDEQLFELVAAGEEVVFDDGDVLFRQGDPADFWWVLIEGRLDILRRVGREEAVALVMDQPGRWAGGFRAWDESSTYLATGRASSPGRMFRVPAAALGNLARAWFPFGVHLITGFFQTVRSMDSLSRQRGALIALGTLAAGLAHEINNPASAAARAVDALQDSCDTLLSSIGRLAAESLPADRFAAIDALRREIDASSATEDPLELANLEDELSTWLDEHGVDEAWRIAPTLASAGVDISWCERAAEVLGRSALEPGLEWVASALSTSSLLSEIKESTGRVSDLVAAMKSYSQVDRATHQLLDVTEGIQSTLVMLAHKLRGGVTIIREFGAEVPRIEGNPGELNQVWTNLIDNAIDAMEGNGTLRISTRVVSGDLVVEIGDTGPGMPPDVQARAFDPFYTTKDVGKGTGLGLDISRRIIVERHRGDISIDSRPNETVLRVRLPLPSPDAPAPS